MFKRFIKLIKAQKRVFIEFFVPGVEIGSQSVVDYTTNNDMSRESKRQLPDFTPELQVSVTLPESLYRAEQVRGLDRLAIKMLPIKGFELMKKAGRAAFRSLLRRWPSASSLTVVCGGGNNGGDGLVIAVLAAQKEISVEVVLLVDPATFKGEAADAWLWLCDLDLAGLRIRRWAGKGMPDDLGDYFSGEIIVDCLLGTGLSGDVRGDYADAIDLINALSKPVLAIDIPSGLCSDKGVVLGRAVKAELTITFIGVKQGLLTGMAPDYVGHLEYDALGVTGDVFNKVQVDCRRADWNILKSFLPRRKRTAHKGDFGRVLVIGGDYGMAGAVLLAAQAACRVGAGLVYAATRPEHVAALVSAQPEIMAKGIEITQHVEAMIEVADTIVIGPGLGQGSWGQQLFQKALSSAKSMVVDADALNLLASQSVAPRKNWILTPHPGEAARLLGCTVKQIEQDRFKAVFELQKKYGGTMILKGSGTLIATATESECRLWLANTGNPGMASGGMGDVMSGLLGGMLSQHIIDRTLLAPTVVSLHGEAANTAANMLGEYSLLASDVVNAVPELLREV